MKKSVRNIVVIVMLIFTIISLSIVIGITGIIGLIQYRNNNKFEIMTRKMTSHLEERYTTEKFTVTNCRKPSQYGDYIADAVAHTTGIEFEVTRGAHGYDLFPHIYDNYGTIYKETFYNEYLYDFLISELEMDITEKDDLSSDDMLINVTSQYPHTILLYFHTELDVEVMSNKIYKLAKKLRSIELDDYSIGIIGNNRYKLRAFFTLKHNGQGKLVQVRIPSEEIITEETILILLETGIYETKKIIESYD